MTRLTLLLLRVSTIIKMSIRFTLCVSALSPSASPTQVVPLSFLHSVCPPPRSVTSPHELALIPDVIKCVLYHHPPQGRSKHSGLSCTPRGGLRLCRKPCLRMWNRSFPSVSVSVPSCSHPPPRVPTHDFKTPSCHPGRGCHLCLIDSETSGASSPANLVSP